MSKEVAKDATALLEKQIGDGSHDATECSALVLIAISALQRLQDHAEANDELRQSAKRARKTLKDFMPRVEHNAEVEQKGLDLGQYAHTKVFDGDAKKAEKFARLMGGAKNTGAPPSPKLHATFAPSSDKVKKMELDIEGQFNLAVSHKAKKGLGS